MVLKNMDKGNEGMAHVGGIYGSTIVAHPVGGSNGMGGHCWGVYREVGVM